MDPALGVVAVGAEGLPFHLDHVESRHPAGDQFPEVDAVFPVERIRFDLPVV